MIACVSVWDLLKGEAAVRQRERERTSEVISGIWRENEVWDGKEEDNMKIYYYGPCCGQGVSLLLEPPQFSWKTRNCRLPFVEGCFRGSNSPVFLGCISIWLSSIPRAWDKMQEGLKHLPEMGCCQCIRHLKHISLFTPSVAVVRGSLGDVKLVTRGIFYS